MEIPKEKFLTLITQVMKSLKELESELMAYQMTLNAFKQVNPTQEAYGRLFEVALDQARISGPLTRLMHDKYDTWLEKIRQLASEDDLNQQVSKVIQEWKPSSLPN